MNAYILNHYCKGKRYTFEPFPSPHPGMNVYVVSYYSQDVKVKAFLVEPNSHGTYSGFLYLRGGIKQVGKARLGRLIQFASEGFLVIAPFYRGNMGGEGREDFGLEDRWDAIEAAKVFMEHPMWNGKLHVFGFSRGGLMALWTALYLAEETTSLVTWGGVSDLTLTYEERVDLRRMLKRVVGGNPTKNPKGYEERTPLNSINQLKNPILIIHGEEDQNVSFEHAVRLKIECDKYGIPYDFWPFSNVTHYFPPSLNRQVVYCLCQWMKAKE